MSSEVAFKLIIVIKGFSTVMAYDVIAAMAANVNIITTLRAKGSTAVFAGVFLTGVVSFQMNPGIKWIVAFER